MLTLFVGAGLLACSGKATPEAEIPVAETTPAEVAEVAEVPEAPETPATPDVPEGVHPVAATWLGEACGSRAYPRELTFHPNFRYQGRDLVSPCPAGATCVWSGVVTYEGTWKDDGPFLALTETSSSGVQGVPRPEMLRRAQSGHLTEEQGEGVVCGYAKSEPGDEAPEGDL